MLCFVNWLSVHICVTGKHRHEFPGHEEPIKESFDKLDWPFIWKNFSANDYITGYLEDFNISSTFDYLKKGFIKQVMKCPIQLLCAALTKSTDCSSKIYNVFMD